MYPVSAVTAQRPDTDCWTVVPTGALLRCPGRTRDPVRLRQGRLRCDEPVIRAAVRGTLRYRVLAANEATLDSEHRCHECGCRVALDFRGAP